MKMYYHAAPLSSEPNILTHGVEPRNIEHTVYLCTEPEDCLKFAALHGVKEVSVFGVYLDVKEVFETFDHNPYFFKCRCWGIGRTVSPDEIKEVTRYRVC